MSGGPRHSEGWPPPSGPDGRPLRGDGRPLRGPAPRARHDGARRHGRNRAANWLLIIPFGAPLLTPLANRVEPQLWGVPFFYWYQLGCVFLAVAVITLVYSLTHGQD
jgi:hypothetical protein